MRKPELTKQEWRTEFVRRRDALDRCADRSRQVICRLAAWEPFRRARTIAAYISFRSEVDTGELLRIAWAQGKQIALPVCRQHTLELFRVDGLEELLPGRFGICEPSPVVQSNKSRAVDVRELDLVFVPGLGFDRRGHRIGYGRGYYDRLLADARPDTLRCGLAFDCQLVDKLPAEAHDIPLDHVATESEFCMCRRI